jgi:hypothetical protein
LVDVDHHPPDSEHKPLTQGLGDKGERDKLIGHYSLWRARKRQKESGLGPPPFEGDETDQEPARQEQWYAEMSLNG